MLEQLNVIIKDVHNHNDRMGMESELCQELKVPVGQWYATWQDPIEQVLPSFFFSADLLPEI